MPRKPLDLTGKKFGSLEALERYSGGRHSSWKCKCHRCGSETIKKTSYLAGGQAKSCGCAERDWMDGFSEYVNKNNLQGHINGTSISKIKKPSAYKNNKEGHVGVYLKKGRNKYGACIRFKKKLYHLGYYDKVEDAISAREQAEEMLFEPFLEWYYEQFPDRKPKQPNP